MRMYAVTTVPTSLPHAARGALQRLVPKGWWHAAAGSCDHMAAGSIGSWIGEEQGSAGI
jgi:hypothetical protein